MLIVFPQIDREGIRQRVWRKYQCEHVDTELRKKVARNGVETFRPQCTKCGDMAGPTVKREQIEPARIGKVALWDEALKDAWWRAYFDELKKEEAEAHAVALAQFRVAYDAYLQTDEWKRKCAKVMKRAGGVCEGCGESKATEVHHLSYAHCGEEFLFELIAVCDPCHRRLHPEKNPTAFISEEEEYGPPPKDDDLGDEKDLPW